MKLLPQSVDSSKSKSMYASYVAFQTLPKSTNWPPWDQYCISSTNSSIVVEYNVTGSGFIYCLAVPSHLSSSIESTSIIFSTGLKSIRIYETGVVRSNFTFSNLLSGVNYDILCSSESLLSYPQLQSLSPFSYTTSHKCSLKTTGQTPIFISSSESNIVVGETSSGISVEMAQSPSDSREIVEVIPKMYYLKVGDDVSECPSFNSNAKFISFISSPTSLSFSSSSSLKQSFKFTVSREGCFYLGLDIDSNLESGNYIIQTTSSSTTSSTSTTTKEDSDNSNMLVFRSYSNMNSFPPPSVEFISFEPDGSGLLMKYNIDTDRGSDYNLNSGLFSCGLLIDFPSNVNYLCQFISNQEVLIKFPIYNGSSVSSSNLPHPRDNESFGYIERLEGPEIITLEK